MMGALRTLCVAILPGLASGTAAPADPLLAREFAICAGRFSALVEHQWLWDGPASEVSAQQRDTFLALVDAAVPPDLARTALSWRIEAKAAQAGLLSRAAFARDARAEKRSAQLLQDCADLIGQS